MLQNREVFYTESQQYLLVHKSGCSSVLKGLKLLFGEALGYRTHTTPGEGVVWSVVRDPYDRFLAGLTYDLVRQFGREFLKDKDALAAFLVEEFDPSTYLLSVSVPGRRSSGSLSHSMMQTLYLFDSMVNIVVPIEDLSIFSIMHFGSDIKANPGAGVERGILEKALLEEVPDKLRVVSTLLEVDYFLMDQLRSEGKVWSWQEGRIF